MEDIRTKPFLDPEDVLSLGFIRNPPVYVFRRYPRAGLRSHILAVLDPVAVRREREGLVQDGVRVFPKAKPLKILRIFRTRFPGLPEAEEEITGVKQVIRFLGPECLALSEEFLVSCRFEGPPEILLCGLQEYVEGAVLDPWAELSDQRLQTLLRLIARETERTDGVPVKGIQVGAVKEKARIFVARTRRLVAEAALLPDLSGVGNLLVDRSGAVRLVDINNISRRPPEGVVPLDDQGYPVWDKSIEALFRIEQWAAGRAPSMDADPYLYLADPDRRRRVHELETRFTEGRGGGLSTYGHAGLPVTVP